MAAAHMELLCWRGAWGLPSVDSGCLIVMAYAHFSNAPVKLKKTGNPRESVTGCLPILKSGDETISKPLNILNCFRKEQYNADYDLSPKQGADTMAFVALIEEKLLPALLHTFWVDDQNYTGVTRPWYASTMPFPFNMFAPYRSSQQALTRLKLSVGRPPYMSLAEMEAQIYWDAKECLNLLSFQLGEKAFFFGEMPSSLDAVVFGHLAPLLKAPLLTKKLQLHLKAIENLCAFCERVLLRCFPGQAPAGPNQQDAKLRKLTQLVNMESNLIEKVALLELAVLECRWSTLYSLVLSVKLCDFTKRSKEYGFLQSRKLQIK
ncbi:unnamed protein product [Lampetra planeri]